MFQVFEDDYSLAPRTYSIKGYKCKDGISVKKIVKYFAYTVITIVVLGVTFLSVYSMV